jgi:hypothetical protein
MLPEQLAGLRHRGGPAVTGYATVLHRRVRAENPAGCWPLADEPGKPGLQDRSFGGWCHQVQVDQFESEAGDPLQESLQAALVCQLGSQGCRAGAHADFAVVELCAQQGTCPACESDLIRSWLHRFAPRSRQTLTGGVSMPCSPVDVITL